MFYLTTHSTHFIYGYMASDIWLRTIPIVRKETRCRHIGYSFRLTARVLLYAPSHRQDSTYHGLCYSVFGIVLGFFVVVVVVVGLFISLSLPPPLDASKKTQSGSFQLVSLWPSIKNVFSASLNKKVINRHSNNNNNTIIIIIITIITIIIIIKTIYTFILAVVFSSESLF